MSSRLTVTEPFPPPEASPFHSRQGCFGDAPTLSDGTTVPFLPFCARQHWDPSPRLEWMTPLNHRQALKLTLCPPSFIVMFRRSGLWKCPFFSRSGHRTFEVSPAQRHCCTNSLSRRGFMTWIFPTFIPFTGKTDTRRSQGSLRFKEVTSSRLSKLFFRIDLRAPFFPAPLGRFCEHSDAKNIVLQDRVPDSITNKPVSPTPPLPFFPDGGLRFLLHELVPCGPPMFPMVG